MGDLPPRLVSLSDRHASPRGGLFVYLLPFFCLFSFFRSFRRVVRGCPFFVHCACIPMGSPRDANAVHPVGRAEASVACRFSIAVSTIAHRLPNAPPSPAIAILLLLQGNSIARFKFRSFPQIALGIDRNCFLGLCPLTVVTPRGVYVWLDERRGCLHTKTLCQTKIH